MFFSDRIKSVSEHDRVLEVGPGGNPWHRSNVFLEKSFEDDDEWYAQSGHVTPRSSVNNTVFYNSATFPFEDKSFDYVVCSHVIEHVSNPIEFVRELVRVAAKGYIEFPLLTYEYLFNVEEHLWLISFDESTHTILFFPKRDCVFFEKNLVAPIFRKQLEIGNRYLVNCIKGNLIYGYEWFDRINVEIVGSLKELIDRSSVLTNNESYKIFDEEYISMQQMASRSVALEGELASIRNVGLKRQIFEKIKSYFWFGK